MSEIVAIVQCQVTHGGEAAVRVDLGLRRAVDGQAFRGFMVALSSDIASCLLVIAMSLAPMTGLICSGLSSNASSSRSTTGRGMSDVVVVVDLTLELLLPPPQPAPRMQIPATATVAAKWRILLRPHSRRNPQPVTAAR